MKDKLPVLGLITLMLILGCQRADEKQMKSEVQKEITVMLLGVYHFNNPGKDTYNMEVDDYYSDRRQQEIREVAGLLEEFNPTKVFVELIPEHQSHIDSLYQLYLSDKIELDEIKGGVNEAYQIGFRLGKQSGGVPIKGIDHSGPWLGDYVDFIADTLKLKFYQKKQLQEQVDLKERQERFAANSIKENLLYLNEAEQISNHHDYYNNIAIRVKDNANILFSYQESEQEIDGFPYHMRSYDFNNIGVELVAEWYKRNLFIYRNIIEYSEANDRVVILIGSGHVFYLNQLLSYNPKFELMKPGDFLAN